MDFNRRFMLFISPLSISELHLIQFQHDYSASPFINKQNIYSVDDYFYIESNKVLFMIICAKEFGYHLIRLTAKIIRQYQQIIEWNHEIE